jgi:hypothetical protein
MYSSSDNRSFAGYDGLMIYYSWADGSGFSSDALRTGRSSYDGSFGFFCGVEYYGFRVTLATYGSSVRNSFRMSLIFGKTQDVDCYAFAIANTLLRFCLMVCSAIFW